eukprot:CAMPEP_0116560860 /NCGR_PEP_ID=MMETSP0397-20121206/11240_1 /TAXON_ID=216820 /ORGANISM="Cyclophora tenuis, Strain ECT3854" /LENGTH=83 /DNA_ID=CAMNT_0004086895 /DNA_START=44 /DNA_END=292 /DNA_ORIENTATION=+
MAVTEMGEEYNVNGKEDEGDGDENDFGFFGLLDGIVEIDGVDAYNSNDVSVSSSPANSLHDLEEMVQALRSTSEFSQLERLIT